MKRRTFGRVIAPVVMAALGVLVSDPARADAIAPAPPALLPKEGFAPLGEEQGVRIYRREQRPGIELAGVGAIAATPERVRRVLLDYARHPRWNRHLKESRVLARGDDWLDVYQRLDLPILDDRDYTLHVVWGADGDVLWLRFAAANERGPAPVKGVVRVTRHEGSWRFDPTNEGAGTRAVYRFYMDLAGSFPSWMGKGQATKDVAALFTKVTAELPSYP
jgi:hypothetical protein